MDIVTMESTTEKSQYMPPELVDYGDASKLTGLGGPGAIDDGSGSPYFS